MQTFKIPIIWQMMGTYEIEAKTLEEALEIADAAPLPEEGDYTDHSFDAVGISEDNNIPLRKVKRVAKANGIKIS